ncbi:hypothetical protein ACLB2K_056557 [Fragaria x ananassa]
MTESLLTFAARELLKKVVALLADEEFSPVCGFKGELAMMHTTLVNLQAMLQAAARLTQDQGDDVKIWVKKIEEIAGDVDDMLDDFGYEVLRCKVELLDQLKANVFSIFDPIVFRHKMGRRIKNINETLVNLENQAAFQLVIAENATCDDPEVLDIQTAFCSDEDEKNIVGRGLGKTTVTKSVYNDSKIGRHFQQKIWMCVSTTFEVEHILGDILGFLNEEKTELKGKAAILKNLQENLERK